jgi:hypothetical protein
MLARPTHWGGVAWFMAVLGGLGRFWMVLSNFGLCCVVLGGVADGKANGRVVLSGAAWAVKASDAKHVKSDLGLGLD